MGNSGVYRGTTRISEVTMIHTRDAEIQPSSPRERYGAWQHDVGGNEGRLGLALDVLMGKQWLAVTIAGATGCALRLCAYEYPESLVASRFIREGAVIPYPLAPLMIAHCCNPMFLGGRVGSGSIRMYTDAREREKENQKSN